MEIHLDAARATLINCEKKDIAGIKEHCLKWIDKSIEMQNYYNQGRYDQDPVKYCYDPVRNSFPTGLLPRVVDYLDRWEIPYTLKFTYDPFTVTEMPETPDWAWDHQKQIINDLLDYRRCIIKSPTASGKSSSIGMIVEKFTNKSIIVVLHQIDLILDLQEKLEDYLEEEVGIIGNGKKQWKRVTVCSARSLYNGAASKFKAKLEACDVLIFDECHHYANKTGEAISDACKNTSYRIGLSATPHIESGADPVLEGVIGPITTVIPDTVMVELGIIHRPDVYFIPVPDPELSLPTMPGIGKPERFKVVEGAIINNDYRNQLIVDIVKAFKESKNNQGCVLTVIEDVKNGHGDKLTALLEAAGVPTISIQGKTKITKRQEVLADFKQGELVSLVATRILNEGKDVPLLELVINAAGGSGERGIIQKVGRALRKDATGRKTRAIIVDFLDEEPYYLHRNSISRMKHLNNRHPGCARVATLEDLYNAFRQSE